MSSKYNLTVISVSERTARIKHESESPSRSQRFYEYRDEAKDLPVVRIPIGLPIYRTANYRTNVMQLRWLKEKGLSENYFSAGEENESVQRIQHDFLWNLAQTEKESVKSIVEILSTEPQKDPILITVNGVVVNGNRRLATLRELEMSHVDCMILPEAATEDDLRDIEVRLQMTPATRLPYGWINECLAISDLQQRGRPIEKIGEMMHLNSSKVADKLLMLSEIDLYLKDWKDSEADYDQLNDAEEIISQVTGKLKRKEGIQKEIARHLAWILLDQRGKDGRIYELRETTGNLTTLVVSKLQEVYSEDIVEGNGTEDELELDLQDNPEQNVEQNIISFLKSAKENDQVQQDIVNICRVVVENQKNVQAGNAALKSVTSAHTSLIEVDLTKADVNTHGPIKKQLDAIQQRVDQLKAEIDRYKAKSH